MDFRRIGELTLIVDCYNANPASMRAAIEDLSQRTVPGRRVAMFGDMLELGRGSAAAHQRLGGLVAAAGFDVLCVVGQKAALVAQAALAQGMSACSVYWAEDRPLAADWLCARLRPNDTVLLKGSRGVRLEEVGEAVEAWARVHACPRPALAHGLSASAGG
jgi:UDP-N-acetylmuramyl pentapeptide synthase